MHMGMMEIHLQLDLYVELMEDVVLKILTAQEMVDLVVEVGMRI